MGAILFAIVLTIVSIAATWWFAWYYYVKANEATDRAMEASAGDVQKLLRATNTLGRMLQQAGIGEPTFDADGNLTGIVLHAVASGGIRVSGSATATVTRSIPPQYDRQHEQPTPAEQESADA
jgi:type II secretory pathway component PulJ